MSRYRQTPDATSFEAGASGSGDLFSRLPHDTTRSEWPRNRRRRRELARRGASPLLKAVRERHRQARSGGGSDE